MLFDISWLFVGIIVRITRLTGSMVLPDGLYSDAIDAMFGKTPYNGHGWYLYEVSDSEIHAFHHAHQYGMF